MATFSPRRGKTMEANFGSEYLEQMSRARVEEFTPFCAAASSNGALPTPSRLSERYLYLLMTWCEHKVQADDAHDTGTDWVGSCRLTREEVALWSCRLCSARPTRGIVAPIDISHNFNTGNGYILHQSQSLAQGRSQLETFGLAGMVTFSRHR